MEFEEIHNVVAGQRFGAILIGIGVGLIFADLLGDAAKVIGLFILAPIGGIITVYYYNKHLKLFKRKMPNLPGQIPPKEEKKGIKS